MCETLMAKKDCLDSKEARSGDDMVVLSLQTFDRPGMAAGNPRPIVT